MYELLTWWIKSWHTLATRSGFTDCRSVGKTRTVDLEQEEWPQYMERLEQLCEVNDITEEDKAAKHCANFHSVIGPALYKLLQSFTAPTKSTYKTFKELVAILTKHCSPQPSEVMQQFSFNFRSRKEEESVATYITELRHLAEFCNFRTMLWDRLTWSIKDNSIQKKLLQEKDNKPW